MHLIHTEKLRREDFTGREKPKYGILSHRWRDGEVTFGDMSTEPPMTVNKHGASKIRAVCEKALQDGLLYVWIDTCCIDKSSSAELSEAINSMYAWYSEAEKCYAYLDDVSSMDNFFLSEWFTRGWTLQELLAPAQLEFYNKDWYSIGTRHDLCDKISEATKIDKLALQSSFDPLSTDFSIAQRMSWASKRATTRPEDIAYSLIGIFCVSMPLLYGEGGRKAFVRLQQEIIKFSDDQSIFAWSSQESGYRGLLATSHKFFQGCHDIIIPKEFYHDVEMNSEFAFTNKGLSIQLIFQSHTMAFDTYAVFLNCTRQNCPTRLIAIYLEFADLRKSRRCARVMLAGKDIQLLAPYGPSSSLKIFVPQYGLIPCSTPRKTTGFRVYFKREASLTTPETHTSIKSIYLEYDSIGSVNIPRLAAKVIPVPDLESKLAAIQLGFDSKYKPFCRLIERRSELPDGTDEESLEGYWFGGRINGHPGACDIKPVEQDGGQASHCDKESYCVLRERGSWYFGIKQRLKKSSRSVMSPNLASPGVDDIDLCVFIAELRLKFSIERRLDRNELLWVVNIDEYEGLDEFSIDECLQIVDDSDAPNWQSSPWAGFDEGRDWKVLRVSRS